MRTVLLAAGLLLAGCAGAPSPDGAPTPTTPALSTTPPDATPETSPPGPTATTPTPLPVGSGMWIVQVTSEFARTSSDGSPWKPAYPGYKDGGVFWRIDEERKRIVICHYWESAFILPGEEPANAVALLNASERDFPAGYYPDYRYAVAWQLPYERRFDAPGVSGPVLVVSEAGVAVDGDLLQPGEVRRATLAYDWTGRVNEGSGPQDVTLHVVETLRFRLLGYWSDPWEFVEWPGCG